MGKRTDKAPPTPTDLNLYVLDRRMGVAAVGTPLPLVDATETPHLRRCLAAGLLEPTGGEVIRLSSKGRAELDAWRAQNTGRASKAEAPKANLAVPAAPVQRERLTADHAHDKLVEIIDDGRIAESAVERVRSIVGLSVWPTEYPVDRALDLLDPEKAPDAGDATPSAIFDLAGVLLAYQAHLDFEAGREHQRGEVAIEVLALRGATQSLLARVNGLAEMVGADAFQRDSDASSAPRAA